MGLFKSDNPKEQTHRGILGAFSVDNIKWEPETEEEAAIIVKKYPYEDFPNGSYLTVAPSQIAVFTNNLLTGNSLDIGSGQAQIEVFPGGTKIKLETGDSRFSIFRNVKHSLTGGESAFHCYVYFINTTYMNDLPWGTQDPIAVDDPLEEVTLHVRAHGMFGAHLEQLDPALAPVQARKFLNMVVGTRAEYTRQDLLKYMRQQILREVPTLLGETLDNRKIGILKIATHLNELSGIIFERLKDNFDKFGMTLDDFSFHSIAPREEDLEEIKRIKVMRREARFEQEKRILEAQGSAAATSIESQALAEKRQREGYTYQQERGFEVMQDAANNEGTGSNFMNAGMGLGMGFGVGGAFGQGMQNIVNQTMGQMQNPMQNQMKTPMQNMASVENPGMFSMFGGNGMPQEQAQMRACPSCGNQVLATAKFCSECGEKFEQGIKCPGCGNIVPQGAKFCLECGTKLVSTCQNCGNSVQPGTKFCPECGTSL